MKRTEPLLSKVLKRLHPIGIGAPSITLLQPLGKDEILVKPEMDLPAGMLKAVRATIRKAVSKTTTIKIMGPNFKSDPKQVVSSQGGYRLALVPTLGPQRPLITTVKAASRDSAFREGAAKASRIFKRDKAPQIGYRLVESTIKRDMASRDTIWERVVTGVVLEPDVYDGTSTPVDDDNPEGERTVGDTYDEETILRGMYWWMENALGSYALHHVEQGGMPLTMNDVALLENWQLRSDQKIGEQLIRKGAWMQTNRVKNTQMGDILWEKILRGEIKSWSIAAQAMGRLEQFSTELDPAGSPP